MLHGSLIADSARTVRTVELMTANWSIIKRDGRQEPFHPEKIRAAIRRCYLNGLQATAAEADSVANAITVRVINFLDAQGMTCPTVEDVQRTVIHQLWADGQAAAAEHYTLYREKRRQARELRPLDPAIARMIDDDAANFATPLQAYQFYSKFARWREADNRRETWTECNARVFDWFATLPQYQLFTEEEKRWLQRMMFTFKASPAMRVVQMAGPALMRCHVGCFNCAYAPIIDLFSFAELLYVLMQGSGMGFSVESDYIGELPRVQRQRGEDEKVTHLFIVEDSTEGWCDALYFGLQKWFAGDDVDYDCTRIRQRGARLKTKGGRASGPGPLKDLLAFVRVTVLKAQGRHLMDVEVHDICCMIGKIVQVGGVRRASCISLSDLDSTAMREAKHGDWYRTNGQRSMANNSATYNERPPVEVFMEELLALVKSKSGERGIFNRQAVQRTRPERRKNWKFGTNPCAEIVLRPFSFCNLSIAVVRGHETVEELVEKVRAAAYFGVIQSCATNFKYVRAEWKRNAEEERLLGVDIMGHLDHLLLCPGAPNRVALVTRLKLEVLNVVADLSARFGINFSAATTCLKPGGDSGAFFDSVSLSPRYGEFIIRRTRESNNSPMANFLKAVGVPHEPAPEDESKLLAFSWPKKAPDGCITRHHMGAIDQLENWLFWKRTWCEHSASVTIYVRDAEWPAVMAWAWEHFDEISGLSFLPWDEGSYRVAPLEEITEQEHAEAVKRFPKIEWSKLLRYEDGDTTTVATEYACTAGGCNLV